ncbi:hypothetical protein [Clostridium botulinum]|uniref:Uncharacterized protein n=1 Tax=Clostridium botulinum TaxID=1491 RepID=A0A0M1M2K3_CLOBO|nr:hypothetical protein [Clostridium botulinum]KOR64117.1 hypothetical protein ADT22_01750 [Clostridium botulinum]MCS6112559.1 hypothetical protein [Clostridium botulinum]NFF88702.1 hypothetical protein [Clostridium botulinum]NFG11224.1 hypothetical protein [Clostridium botulinum]NFL43416.1 hypothetical protein [Clostridium botulinum]
MLYNIIFLSLVLTISFYLIICKYNGIGLLNMLSSSTIEEFLNKNNRLAITTIIIIAILSTVTMLMISFSGSLTIKNYL